jgi:hypothetical protein
MFQMHELTDIYTRLIERIVKQLELQTDVICPQDTYKFNTLTKWISDKGNLLYFNENNAFTM